MTTANEFIKSGITGQTFREISEKFGKSFNAVVQDDPVMGNYAIAFSWFRERERLAVPAAYDKAMGLTTADVEAIFDKESDEVKAAVDFGSLPSTTTP